MAVEHFIPWIVLGKYHPGSFSAAVINTTFPPNAEPLFAKMITNRATDTNNLLVCLKNGSIRIYNDKNLVSNVDTNSGVNGIIFGMYGREEGCLVLNSSSGGMMAKIIQRKANLTAP